MKRDSTCNVSIATEHPLMSEDANLKATYRPGKEGGTFGLPLGAKLIVGEGVGSKKDYVTCQVASPAHRWRHSPTFPGEHVTSEFFTLSGNILKQNNAQQTARAHKTATKEARGDREAVLILPYYPPPGSYVQLTARAVWEGQGSWQEVPFVHKTDTSQPCLEVGVQRMGTFLVTFRPRTDPLPHLTPQGGLFHSRLNRNISLRFPKKTVVDTTVQYDLEITEVPEELVAFCKEHFPIACVDLLRVSEFINLHPSHHNPNFRRCATIKLPLPVGVTWEEGSANQIVVLHKGSSGGGDSGSSWQWVDCKYRFTRNSVTFDLKNPNMLCVVQSTPDRHRKMQEAVTLLERHLHTVRGDVTLFLSLQAKSWRLVLDCCPLSLTPAKLQTRQGQGFATLHKTRAAPPPQQNPPPANKAFSSRRPPLHSQSLRPRAPVKQPDGVPLSDGVAWTVEVSGDLRGTPRSEMVPRAGLQWFRHLPDSYRLLGLEPATDHEGGEGDGRDLEGVVTLTPVGLDDPELLDQLTMQFHVRVPEQAVKDFRSVPQKPVTTVEAEAGDEEEGPVKPQLPPVAKAVPTASVAAKKRVFTFSQTPMERLTQQPRRFTPADKEARVLNGRSLAVLAKLVDNGVALAIQLGLNESTVSGIGFDTMSHNTRGLSDMTYKILLHWKRACKQKQDGAVQDLVTALRQLDKTGLAQIVLDSHRHNKELTMDCFYKALVNGVDLSA